MKSRLAAVTVFRKTVGVVPEMEYGENMRLGVC